MSNNNLSNWLSGLLIGGAIGAAVALLITPRSGEDTRTMIRDKSMEIRDTAVQTYEDSRERLDDLTAGARSRVSKLKNVGEEIVAEQKDLLEKGAKKAKRAVKEEPVTA